ncbi:MAG: glutamate 5-kinase [Candidatus Omnitrophica bacterium CG1_02_44_16]|nr:MAG: glutamate 5-kinase [Candidatus Omnitrophica bacterium CG1_02_44_16]PIY83708.1 MAG: glutamate 5-kinase [Candidatus Omnitrophica bacterium CG_4_10_14_0_8_um_filter_44_12]PIZ83219.1 MAG: glutamate 5-kinase [Candidatus Omnitrophica bacterium CG_4_10_14_0_2_um_filter_44_9]
MKRSRNTSKKIVVKVGASILTGGSTSIVVENLSRVVRYISGFVKEGKNVVLVTSGAIASGLSALRFKKRPIELSELQAAAAVGQNILMHAYSIEFRKCGLICAQILLTRDDFSQNRKKYLCNTIDTLLRHKIIPVINENDSVSVDEIKIGDNDTLSAYVAVAIKAYGLLILTDIDGLYESFDIKTGKYGKLNKDIKVITPVIERMACGTDKATCVGGMSTKIRAAQISTSAGIPVVLASGTNMESLRVSFDPSRSYKNFSGTRFAAVGTKK